MVPTLTNDVELLTILLEDAKTQPALYNPGPYWHLKSKIAANQIRRHGIEDFRGYKSSIGTSFADNVYVDTRNALDHGARRPFKFLLERVFPFADIFNAQVRLTMAHAKAAMQARHAAMRDSARTHYLLARYKMPPSTLGGCVDAFELNGDVIAASYLSLLDTHDRIAQSIDFKSARCLFEIGGGFGVNVHLLLENYPRLRKVAYLDIPPNLYVGTQYLRALYGDAVRDYRTTRLASSLTFATDDELEILAIAPWQIEQLQVDVDIFYNAHSFVEMSRPIVSNYVEKILQLQRRRRSLLALVTYEGFDPSTTIPPDELPGFFAGRLFERSTFPITGATFGAIAFVSP